MNLALYCIGNDLSVMSDGIHKKLCGEFHLQTHHRPILEMLSRILVLLREVDCVKIWGRRRRVATRYFFFFFFLAQIYL